MLYPLKFQQIYIKKIWGGNKIREHFKLPLELDNVGEAWLLSDVEEYETVISVGKFKGKRLNDFFENKDRQFLDIFGKDCEKFSRFPLLYKFIDSNDKLSIQVHPNDLQAKNIENQKFGKSEMWYALANEENSNITVGFKDRITLDQFKNIFESNRVEDSLNKINFKKDDAVLIKAGTVHAINEGLLIYEIQQNSNTTYRIYDYNRVDKKTNQKREIHYEKACKVIDFNNNFNKNKISENLVMNIGKNRLKVLGYCQYFALNLFTFNEAQTLASAGKFYVHTCIEGRVKIVYDKLKSTTLQTGETALIPAKLGEYTVIPLENKPAKTLFSYIPDMESDIEKPLLKLGYSISQIMKTKF